MKKTEKKSNKNNKWGGFLSQLISVIFLFVLLSGIYSLLSTKNTKIQNVTMTEIAESVKNGTSNMIIVYGTNIESDLKDGTVLKAQKENESSATDTLVRYGVTPAQLSAIPVQIKDQSGFKYMLMSSFPFLIPLILGAFILFILLKQMKGSGMQAFNFGQSRARIIDPNDIKNRITFKDVAGAREAKQELSEIVDFLKDPKKFFAMGAKIPKGVLLTGAPGTGKTLLARAVAGEAQVPFFHLSGSEFVELFVGVGASRVRDLFKTAKKMAPAIVFIDEIDAVGRSRGVGTGGGNDEREQTLNQILVEMDGFEPTDQVIVMAATNRSDVLDSALLRPGRFDRRVVLDIPDRRDRLEIMQIHAKGKPFGPDVVLDVIAARTPGFSGADLYSVMNESALLAGRKNQTQIFQKDLTDAVEKVMIGPERQSHLMGEEEKKLTAYHEAGHALLASLLPHADPVHKVSIVSRGNAGGYTLKIPLDDKRLHSRNSFLDDIVVSLGGYVTEEMVFGDVTTGPSNDLQVATSLAREMVSRFGMGSDIGPMACDPAPRVMFGNAVDGELSPALRDRIDVEVEKIMKSSYKRAQTLITENKIILDAIADKLVEVETLEQSEYNEIIRAHGVEPKVKKEI